MPAKFTLESNREYWEDPKTISIIDRNLHELEIQFVEKHILPHHLVADIGCGNGEATLRYAAKAKHCLGVDRSNLMRETATKARDASALRNVEFIAGDVLDLPPAVMGRDVIVTQRVLINLPDWSLQARAIDNIHRCLAPRGLYVLIENTHDANDIMNSYRDKVGLPPIPIHWHNHFLDLSTFLKHIEGRFRLVERHGFNLYYLLTRVYVQMFASFTGSGRAAKADPIFARSDEAARILSQLVGDRLEFKDNAVFGPIQGFVLEKIT